MKLTFQAVSSYVAKSGNQRWQRDISNEQCAESTVQSFDGNCAQIIFVPKCLELGLEVRLVKWGNYYVHHAALHKELTNSWKSFITTVWCFIPHPTRWFNPCHRFQWLDSNPIPLITSQCCIHLRWIFFIYGRLSFIQGLADVEKKMGMDGGPTNPLVILFNLSTIICSWNGL